MDAARNIARALFLALGVTACDRGGPMTKQAHVPATTPAMVNPDFDGEHAKAVAQNPSGLTVLLRTRDGRTKFRLGERIPVEMHFSSTKAEAYTLDMMTHDRSGRLWTETFHTDPAAIDPLASYFRNHGSMGGLSPLPRTIRATPIIHLFDLNEWVRFDSAGRHRVFATSTRVSLVDASDATALSVASDLLELELVDDPAWASAELKRVRKVLSADRASNQAQKAFRALRFLATAEAAQEIAQQLCIEGENYVPDLHFGAYGVRDREKMMAALQDGLLAPHCAVSESYIGTLAKLQMAAAPPPSDWGKTYRSVTKPMIASLSAVLETKSPEARAVSTHTVLNALQEDEQRAGVDDPQAAERRRELAAQFDKLTDDVRARILTYEWATIRSQEMTPVLARLVEQALPRGGQLRSLSDLALERWLELDPKSARDFILAELARPDGARISFSGRTLGLLPDKSLPALDRALIAGMRVPGPDGRPVADGITLELRAEIAARYASSAVVKDIWTLYRESTYFRMSLLTYLLREDPEPAKAIVFALSLDDLRRLGTIQWSRAIQDATIAWLEKPEPHHAARAAQLLGEYADERAQEAVWKRLRAIDPTKLDNEDIARLHSRLRQTITTATGWVVTPKEIDALAALCATDECRRDVNQLQDRWKDGEADFVLWSNAKSGEVTGWLGQYSFHTLDALRQKIKQLPSGTILRWATEEDEVERATLLNVKAWLAEREVRLRRE